MVKMNKNVIMKSLFDSVYEGRDHQGLSEVDSAGEDLSKVEDFLKQSKIAFRKEKDSLEIHTGDMSKQEIDKVKKYLDLLAQKVDIEWSEEKQEIVVTLEKD